MLTFSSDPGTAAEVAAAAAAKGSKFVDAPVSGGTGGAEQGMFIIIYDILNFIIIVLVLLLLL
jgi:3-hydroxyisobutyrate dehydrogenase-like beta-hydroxyacid dehydrogenase